MLDRCPTQLISSYLDKIIAPMVKTLSSYVKDSQHTLEIFRDFNFLGQKNSFSLRISLYSILLCPILNYCILFYPILFYYMILYYKSTSLSLSLSRLLIPSLKQFVKVVPLSRIGFLSFKWKLHSSMADRNETGQHKSYSYFSGMQFSTKVQDSDLNPASCAQYYKGAWWYKSCHESNLNGFYFNGQHASRADGVNWKTFRDHYYSLKRTEMKVEAKG